MILKPTGYYKGREVRINFDTKEVEVRKSAKDKIQKEEVWVKIPLSDVGLNTWYSQSIDTKYGRFSVKDIGLSLQDISRGLELMRLDSKSATRIWSSPNAIKGKRIAFDFSTFEIAFKLSAIVFPFEAVAGVTNESSPQIVYKHICGKDSIDGIGITAVELAERLGVPIIE